MKAPTTKECPFYLTNWVGIFDLRFTIYDLRLHLVIWGFAVATTPSSSCVAREGRNPLRPGLWPQADSMARAPSPRKHPRSDDALVVVRCTGRFALVATVTRHPPPSTHCHLHLLHFYTAIFHDGEGAIATGGSVATSATLPPCALKPTNCHLPTTHYINAIANHKS